MEDRCLLGREEEWFLGSGNNIYKGEVVWIRGTFFRLLLGYRDVLGVVLCVKEFIVWWGDSFINREVLDGVRGFWSGVYLE